MITLCQLLFFVYFVCFFLWIEALQTAFLGVQCMCSTLQPTVFENQKMREIPRQIHLLHYPKIRSFCMVERHCHSSVYYNYSPVCVCVCSFFLISISSSEQNRVPLLAISSKHSLSVNINTKY